MSRILFWIAVVFAVLFALRLANVAKAKRRAGDGAGSKGRTPRAEPMVQCERCGVFLPRAEAVAGPAGMVCGGAGCAERH